MKKLWMALLASITLVLGAAVPAGAVTDGELDGEGHPYVGLMVAQDASGAPMWRCSGTLISPTVYVTAGHCTFGAAHVEIWFDADVESGRPGNGYPNTGDIGGTPYAHPQYDDNAFYLYDLGVVVLDEPIAMSEYGELPEPDLLDSLKPRRSTTFTAVGYGLQKAFPDATAWKEQADRVRYVAEPHLLQINTGFTGPRSLMLSNNANTGGTCFGDSGGPNFVDDSNVIAGVTSFGMNSTCAGTGGVFRIDRPAELEWINSFL
jgi:hypothetical protein